MPHEIRFGRLAPTLAVTDMARALSFYVGVLGMKKTFENGRPTSFVILERDAAELHLTLTPTPLAHPENAAHMLVADARGLHDLLVAHGATIVKPLRDADHGLRGFVFEDPDGHRIDVGERL